MVKGSSGIARRMAVLALAVISSLPSISMAAGPAQGGRSGNDDDLPVVVREDWEKDRIRANQIGIVTGSPKGVYAAMGADLVRLLNDRKGSRLRVASIIGEGSIGNIDDLLNLGGVDFAILQADVLQAYERTSLGGELRGNLRYVSRLHNEYLHVLTRKDVIGDRRSDVCVLQGKRINVSGAFSGTWLTVRSVLERSLGLHLVYDDSRSVAQGIEQLKSGQVDAVAYVVGRQAAAFKELSAATIVENELELLAIPRELFTRGCTGSGPASGLDDTPYEFDQFTQADYDTLVYAGQPIPTVVVPSVLAVYAWRKGERRYEATNKFIEAFFENAPPQLAKKEKGYASNWCGIDLARKVGGWERVDVAEKWIANHGEAGLRIDCRESRPAFCDDEEALNAATAAWVKNLAGPSPSIREIIERSADFKAQNCGS